MSPVFHNVTSDVIFPNYLWSYQTEVSNEGIIEDINKLRAENPKGRSGSNRGGWQSPLFCTYDEPDLPHLKALERDVAAFVNTQCRNLGADIYVHEMTWWANVNNRYDYNTLHHHTNTTDFFAVYYPKYPESSGEMKLVRTDAGSYSCLAGNLENGCYFPVRGEVGRVYVFPGHLYHSVEPHTSDEERYSVALNCCCKPNSYHKYAIH